MKRRTFLKSAGLAAGGLAASASLPGFVGGQAIAKDKDDKDKKDAPKVWKGDSGRPNILVILVDQLRFPQGLYTQEIMDVAAPNLKALREKSVSFEGHFAAAAMCSPSRSTMLTGLYTHQNGVFLTSAGAGFPATPDLDPDFPNWGSILNSPDFRYNTYWWGKWHLSEDDQTTPDYAQRYGFIDGGLPCPAPNTGFGLGLGADPITVGVFKNWLDAYNGAETGPWCTTVSLTNPHDVAWFPSCTIGSPARGILPQPGEDTPPRIFHELPSNFERWPEAGLPPGSGVPGAQGKPTLQQYFLEITNLQGGLMPANPVTPAERELWHKDLDLYVQVTNYVDRHIGEVLDSLNTTLDQNGNPLAENTIIVFTSDHGEYAGSHGMRNKGFAVYEESIHVPFYVYDPTGKFIPADKRGTRSQFTSHVDLLPLLMTLAGGDNGWRQKQQYAHLAARADLAAMLSNPDTPGRDYIVTTSDEDYPELLGQAGILPAEVVAILEKFATRPPSQVIGYRTRSAKLGVNSYFAAGTINIVQGSSQQAELYNYQQDGFDEVINHSPSGSAPDPALFAALYDALFNPTSGAVATELRQPLPRYLKQVQRRALRKYIEFQQKYQPAPPVIEVSVAAAEAYPDLALAEESVVSTQASASQIYMPLVGR